MRCFYDHTCRDEDDLKRCVDYIHVNPLKDGLVVTSPIRQTWRIPVGLGKRKSTAWR
ncbi:MAG: hypothetical protein JKY95_16350 [Planctomycetaceae bacterium]|nr:hypothetical protein [Planctomycetaceae bacterium]